MLIEFVKGLAIKVGNKFIEPKILPDRHCEYRIPIKIGLACSYCYIDPPIHKRTQDNPSCFYCKIEKIVCMGNIEKCKLPIKKRPLNFYALYKELNK